MAILFTASTSTGQGLSNGRNTAAGEASPSTNAPVTLDQYIDEAVDWRKVFANEQSKAPLQPITVLRWNSPTRGSKGGATVLWIDRGRPEAVTSIYEWDKRLVHGFNSLSRGKIVARNEAGVIFWHPTEPCVEFQPIPGAPVPAETPSARALQMKSLSREFTTTLVGWKPDNSDRQELRRLPTALFRYQSTQPNVLDGSIFAYVLGTTPEALLMIEAVKAEDGYRWEYCFVRHSVGALEGKLKGATVWTAERNPRGDGPSCFTAPHQAIPEYVALDSPNSD